MSKEQERARNSTRHGFGAVLSVMIGFVVVFAAWVGVRSLANLGYQPATVAATKVAVNRASLTLSVFPNSYPCHGSAGGAPGGGADPGWVTFCPSTSLQVPANTVVTMTILQYDTPTTLHNKFFDTVRGTVGGTMSLNGRPITSVPASDVAHTFTLQSLPTKAAGKYKYLFVSVPLVGVPNSTPNTVTIAGHLYPKPNVIRFRFRTGPAGTYVWHCYDPCGTGLEGYQKGFGGPMATTGYMSGTLTVVG
ncbi:MAG: hypothetical protein M1115_00100 [Actinobacteria bacterium]|nr:hypothetical protein [Actinomycetota bacterium]